MNGLKNTVTKFSFFETLKQLISHYKKFLIFHYNLIFKSRKKFKLNNFETKNIINEINKNSFIKLKDFFDQNSLIKIKKKFDEQINNLTNLYFIENTNNKNFQIKNLSSITQDVTLKEPLINLPELISFIKDLRIKAIADSYFKTESFLTGINLRKSFVNNLNLSGTQKFHVDRNSYKVLKFFIYLNNVSVDDGPTVIVKGTNKIKHNFWYYKHRYLDEEIYNIYGKKKIVELTANLGDIYIADTTCYHKGKKPINNDRYLLTLSFGILKDKNQQYFKIDPKVFNELDSIQKKNISRIVNII